MSDWPQKDEAQKILDEFVSNKNLKKHAYAMEAVIKATHGIVERLRFLAV
jgi:predicted hydrolase (HD superfamily)